jgi:DNA-directed RNA polymerase specialized sigma24 family protein
MTIMVREMKVLDIVPDLRKWAQSMRSNPVQAAALVEETLELALEEFEAFIPSPDQRLWLFKLMKDIQRGR